jgi:hypothetical protein
VIPLAKQFMETNKRVNSLSAELVNLNEQWTRTSTQLAEARRAESGFDALVQHTERIIKERDAPSWAPVLRGIVVSAGKGIDLREVRARLDPGDAGTWSLTVGGVANGTVPRQVAEQFRVALQRELERMGRGVATTRFERLEDLAEAVSVGPPIRRGIFTISASISFAGQLPTAPGQGG